MTPEQKAAIDALSHYDLLYAVRFAKPGDHRMQGDHGRYWMERYGVMRSKDQDQAVRDSKDMGWG